MKETNYDITKEKMRLKFLEYDQVMMKQKFHLESDKEHLYLKFLGKCYRIHCFNGIVEWSINEFQNVYAAGYHETMILYDVLCYSKDDCHLAGEFCPVNSLPGVAYCATPGDGLFDEESRYFAHKTKLLAAVCEKLGGKKQGKGDVSYCLPMFDFLPIVVQFWESDEEFSASFQVLWDKNILNYMHYETTYYVMEHLIKRLKEEISTTIIE